MYEEPVEFREELETRVVPRRCCPRVGEVQPNPGRAVYRRAGRVRVRARDEGEGGFSRRGGRPEGASARGAVPFCFDEGGDGGDVSACVEDFVYNEGGPADDFGCGGDAADGAQEDAAADVFCGR